jgi:hypothetical protein
MQIFDTYISFYLLWSAKFDIVITEFKDKNALDHQIQK